MSSKNFIQMSPNNFLSHIKSLVLRFKAQSINSVWVSNRCLFWELRRTHNEITWENEKSFIFKQEVHSLP